MAKFGELLLDESLITRQELDLCLQSQKLNPHDRIGAILKHYNFISDGQIAQFIAKEIGWELFKGPYVPDESVINKLGFEFFNKNQIYPAKNGMGTVFVVSYIDNVETTDYLREKFPADAGNKNVFAIGIEKEIRAALDILALEESRRNMNVQAWSINGQDEDNITLWLDHIINQAAITGSTDIHIEPTAKAAQVRFRIDGVLKFVCCVNKEHINAVANVVLNRCHANPGDYGFQEGGFSHASQSNGQLYDIRFSQIPSVYGPAVVLRLHDKIRASIPLKNLGLSEEQRRLIDEILIKPHGIVLVTGPTGCGKSTTLYAMLNEIKTIDKKILTIEDPVEIRHSLMTQLQINQGREVTFDRAVRAFLRHDPDILLIGEIRDSGTAQEAVRAAITGHRVFSTLHTNGALESLLRLKDLGIDPINIASSLSAVISQRLVRKLCEHCRKETRVFRDQLDLHQAKYLMEDSQSVCESQGCGKCNEGYWGRTLVAEVMVLDEQTRKLIGKNRISDVPELWWDSSHRRITGHAQQLVKEGILALEEAVRILG